MTTSENMFTVAENYFNMGLAVVPIEPIWNDAKQKYDKKPAVEGWKEWQTQTQTREEFIGLHLENYSMFAVICGSKISVNGETVYFSGIDRDIKGELSEDTKQKSRQAISAITPITRWEKTPSGGEHLLYFSRKQPYGHKPSKTGMELLGTGNLIVMYPSKGYELLNDNQIVVVDDVETLFFDALEKVGLYKKEHQQTSSFKPSFISSTEPRPCIIEALKQQLTGGNGHLMRLAIAAEYKSLNYPTEQIIQLFKSQLDFDFQTSLTQIESADPQKTATCQSISEYGYCLPNCIWKKQQSGQEITLPIELFKDDLETLALDPNNEQRFLNDIHRKVKEDDVAVIDTFHTGLSTYMEPNNLIHKSQSGAGKTYSTVETMDYFPPEDIITIGTQSPKVLSHQQGELMTLDPNGKEIPFSYDEAPEKPKSHDYKGKPEDYKNACEEYKRQRREYEQKIKNHYTLIRLAGKGIVFLDSINPETFEMYKTLLSHDKPKIIHEFVDDKGNVHRTVLEGWPSATFCTADPRILSKEFLTRTFSDYLQTNQGKIAAAQEVIDNATSDPWEYGKETEEKQLIRRYIREVRDTIKKFNIKSVQPFPHLRNIIEFSNTVVRDMRDYGHFNQLVPTYTMFKLFQRPIITIKGEHRLVATIDDVYDALEQFHKIEETTRSGTEKTVLDFYHDFIATIDPEKGATVGEIQEKSNVKSGQTIRDRLKVLEQAGYVNIEEGLQKDKRRWTIFPIKAKIDETTTDSQNDADLKLKLQKDAESWIKTSSLKYPSMQIEKIDFRTRQLVPISIDEFKKLIGIDSNSKLLVLNEGNNAIRENTLESTLDSQTVVDSSTSISTKLLSCKRLEAIDKRFNQKCLECGSLCTTEYRLTLFDKSTRDICASCGERVIAENYVVGEIHG